MNLCVQSLCMTCRRESFCPWKYKSCWGLGALLKPEMIPLSTDVRISLYSQGNRGQQEAEECLTMLCSPGLREQWVGHQCGWGWQLRRARPHLRHPPSCHRQSQDQRQVVGHWQGQLQKDPDGKYPSKPGCVLCGFCILGVCPSACPLLELFIPNRAVCSVIRKLITQRASLRHRARGNLAVVSKTMPLLNWAESVIRLLSALGVLLNWNITERTQFQNISSCGFGVCETEHCVSG